MLEGTPTRFWGKRDRCVMRSRSNGRRRCRMTSARPRALSRFRSANAGLAVVHLAQAALVFVDRR